MNLHAPYIEEDPVVPITLEAVMSKCTWLYVLAVSALLTGCSRSLPTEPSSAAPDRAPQTLEQFQALRDSLPAMTLEQLAAVAKTLLERNPSAPRGEQVALLWSEFRRQPGPRMGRPLAEPTKSFGLLTGEETWLLLTNPWYVSATSYATAEAQYRATAVWPNMAETLTRRDAFRHAYWNMLLAKFCSLDWAQKFTTAHESESPPGNERTMDYVNNAYGRSLFRTYGIRYNSEYVSIVRNQRYIYVTTFNQSYAGLVFLRW